MRKQENLLNLTSAPILITPDFSKQFILLCDAIACGIVCLLPQEWEGVTYRLHVGKIVKMPMELNG